MPHAVVHVPALQAAHFSAIPPSGVQVFRSLAGKVALITGAAQRTGRATAAELARRGTDIALLDIADPEAIPALKVRE